MVQGVGVGGVGGAGGGGGGVGVDGGGASLQGGPWCKESSINLKFGRLQGHSYSRDKVILEIN